MNGKKLQSTQVLTSHVPKILRLKYQECALLEESGEAMIKMDVECCQTTLLTLQRDQKMYLHFFYIILYISVVLTIAFLFYAANKQYIGKDGRYALQAS